MGVKLQHLLQPAPLVRDMDAAIDYVQTLFGAYPSERVRITPSGVDNAVYAFGSETFLELICPYDPAHAAWRLLDRRGPGWHMCSFDVVDDAASAVEPDLDAAGVRVVRKNTQPDGLAAWHMHPRDVAGALTLVAARPDQTDNQRYAGSAYREYVKTNTRVVGSILGVSWIGTDADAVAGRLSEIFQLSFSLPRDDGDSVARRAVLPSGTWIEARSPTAANGMASAFLQRCGPGLYHIAFDVADPDELRLRTDSLGLDLVPRGGSHWIDGAGPLAMPIELAGDGRSEHT